MPVGGDAGEMEEMLPGELGEMVEGPVELVLDPAADDREGLKEGSVAVEKDEAEEVEECDAEAEAGGGAQGAGGVAAETGDSAGVVMPEGSKRDLASGSFWDVGRFWCGASLESRKENFVWSWEDRPRSRFVIAMVKLLCWGAWACGWGRIAERASRHLGLICTLRASLTCASLSGFLRRLLALEFSWMKTVLAAGCRTR